MTDQMTDQTRPPIQARPAIVSLFGGWLVFMDNWIAIADLVSVLEPLGLKGPAIRAAVGRLKKSGLLSANTREGVAGYSASDKLRTILDEGEARIFTSEVPASLEDGWVLAVFSVPETQRDQRRQLRNRLISLGFGPIASGVFLAPSRVGEDARQLIERDNLSGFVHLFRADYLGFDSIVGLARSAWDFDELGSAYRRFVLWNGPAIEQVNQATDRDKAAFVACIRALEDWRPLPYRDPGLPDELQTSSHERAAARDLFAQIGAELKEHSNLYVRTTLRQFLNEGPSPTEPKAGAVPTASSLKSTHG